MNINNLLRSRCCSFCSNSDHDIRQCNSSSIVILDRRLTEGFYSIWQQGTSLQMEENLIKERFIIWAMNSFHLRDLKVIAVTTTDVSASGRNKQEYASDIWQVYKTLLTRILSSSDVGNIVNEGVLNETIDINSIALAADSYDSPETEITWSIDREGSSDTPTTPIPMPSRHQDIEMMSLPSIRTMRANRIRERRLQDIYSYTPNPEFVTFMRNMLNDGEDFVPFQNVEKKYNINVELSTDLDLVDKVGSCCIGSCCICMNDEIKCDNMVTLNCQHEFCSDCIVSLLNKHNNSGMTGPCCALCRTEMKQFHVNNADVLAQLRQFCSM
jgi:hypothetical protein